MSALLALALLASPAEAKPFDLAPYKGITVDYTMTTKGTSSCATTFRGVGIDPVVDGGRITFTGTWEIVKDSCQGNTVWGGAPGETAHHTLRLDAKGKGFEEWVVHKNAADHTRFESNIKARGQYWINELGVAAGDGFHYTATETQGMFPLSLEITHDLKVDLLTEAPELPAAPAAEEAPAEEAAPEEAAAPAEAEATE